MFLFFLVGIQVFVMGSVSFANMLRYIFADLCGTQGLVLLDS